MTSDDSQQGPVLVTGAAGLVGRAVVDRLLADGREVVATDLVEPADLPPGAEVIRTDLTDDVAVRRLLLTTAPSSVVHCAAVIPPACYARPRLARQVTVGGTRNLVAAAEGLAAPPRLVLTSSIAVHGARNPHTHPDPLTEESPLAPVDLYGQHKMEAEEAVRGSGLPWVVLRLGGVLSPDLGAGGSDPDTRWFEALLPTDGRIQTVDVRDVARAVAAATTAPVTGQVFLVGGDASHRLRQREIVASLTTALGLEDGVPAGRSGDPEDDAAWFPTDWMDTTRGQAALDYQQISWPQLLAEVREGAGWRRYLLRLAAPIVHEVLRRRSPYAHHEGRYAAPWAAIEARWGDPRPDREG